MYGLIWRHLPGGTASKTPLSLVLVLAVAALLLFGSSRGWSRTCRSTT